MADKKPKPDPEQKLRDRININEMMQDRQGIGRNTMPDPPRSVPVEFPPQYRKGGKVISSRKY